MEVKLNTNVTPISPTSVRKQTKSAASATDSIDFDGSAQLNQSLQMTADVRPEKVQRAEQLLGDVTYPPPETIRRIAALLAMHLDLADQ